MQLDKYRTQSVCSSCLEGEESAPGRGGSQRRDGLNEQVRVSTTSDGSSVLLLSVQKGGYGESKAAHGEKAQACGNAPVLCETPCHRWATLKRPSLCLLSTPTQQDFHSHREKDAAVQGASQRWLSLLLRVLVTMRSFLLISHSSPVKNIIFSEPRKGQRKRGGGRHDAGSLRGKPSWAKDPA